MKLPHVTWLKSFECAARHSSFAAAADELNLTAAAVSQQIRLLENYLGVQLFKRLPKGVELTDIGQAYAQPVRKSFSEMQLATQAMFGKGGRKTIKVRASISYATLVLAPQLHAFKLLYPEIEVQLMTSVWADRIDDEMIDVDIRYGNGEWEDRIIADLGQEYASVVCHPGFAAAFGDQLSINSLAQSHVVQIIGSEFEWARLSEYFNLRLAPCSSWMKADSSLMALQIVSGGMGSAIVVESFISNYIKQGLVVAPFDYRLPIQQSFYLVTQEKSYEREEVVKFCQWVSALRDS